MRLGCIVFVGFGLGDFGLFMIWVVVVLVNVVLVFIDFDVLELVVVLIGMDLFFVFGLVFVELVVGNGDVVGGGSV